MELQYRGPSDRLMRYFLTRHKNGVITSILRVPKVLENTYRKATYKWITPLYHIDSSQDPLSWNPLSSQIKKRESCYMSSFSDAGIEFSRFRHIRFP